MINKLASKLDLSNQKLKEFPAEIFECKNLIKLNLSNNSIKVIPKEIIRLKRLKNLDLSNNKLNTLYAQNFSLPSLEILILNNNELKSIPKQIDNAKKLKKFSVSGNNLKNLPSELGKLESLISLNISNNEFLTFPPAILNLTSLRTLWLNNNAFNNFPVVIIKDKLSQLRALYCFSILNKASGDIDKDLLALQAIKGNCIGKINLLAKVRKDKLEPTKETSRKKLPAETKNLFISYCHADDLWLKKINITLKTMEYEGLDLDVWDDKRIKTGDLWKKEIELAIEKADIAILIVTSDFLASKFIREKEVPALLKLAQDRGTKILPVIARKCRFAQSPIGNYQAINKPEEPLNSLSEFQQDEIFYKLTEQIDFILGSKHN